MAESLPPGGETFRWAAVADKFRALPFQVALLTDAQIDRILFHPRDEDGALVPPKLPKGSAAPTKAERLATVARLRAMGVITAERAEEMRREVEALPDG